MDRTEDAQQGLPRLHRCRRSPHLWPVAALVAATVLLYLPVLGFDFLNWDDGWYVTNNEQIRSWHPANLYRIATEPSVKNYAPLTTLSFLVDYTVWGDEAGGFHFTNLLLHCVNAVLAYALLWRLTQNRATALLAAALFAVHPVQVESVAWVSSRKGLLSAAFTLASLIYWLRPQRTGRDEALGTLFLLLALLAKALAVVVPAVVLTYDIWIRRKPFADSLARQMIPGFAAAMFLLLTISAQTTMYGGVRGHMSLGKLEILAIDTVILWRYVGSLIWPDSLCVLYDPPTAGIAIPVALASAGWLVVIVACWRLRDRFPHLRWALFSAFVFLVPVLNLVPITTLMNDRYLYLPSIAVFGLSAVGMQRLFAWIARWHDSRIHFRVAIAVSVVAVGFLSWQTHRYLPVWRNGTSLWTYAHRRLPDSPLVNYQLADAHYNAGQRRQAIQLLETALTRGNADNGDRRRFTKTLAVWNHTPDQGNTER